MYLTLKKTLLTLAIIFCLGAAAQAQSFEHGIGLRLGEPFGITYKRYLSDYKALEFIIGRNYNLGSGFYRRDFNNTNNFNGLAYVGHTVDVAFAFQARWLSHVDFLDDHIEGMKGYYGLGALMGYNRVDYLVDNIEVPGVLLFEETRNNFDLGAEAIAGVEYTLYNFPVSFFGEVSLYTEIADNPFRFRLLGAIGARYNFQHF